jgi:hypothetical protein
MNYKEILSELSQAERKRQAGVIGDQFFTRPEVAKEFSSWVKSKPFMKDVTRIIDPCAGAKAVSRFFPGAEEYDLYPQSSDIIQQDFLTSNHKPQPGTLVIMNPPYGVRNDLTIAFFNKAATFADYIAQIVPRSFRRPAVQNRTAPNFELLDQYLLPWGAFFLPSEGRIVRYDVPSVAQIWVKVEAKREVYRSRTDTRHFRFVRADDASFAFRRKGRSAGEIVVGDEIRAQNPNSFFFIQGDENVLNAFRKVDWKPMGNDVIGARSISKDDVIRAVEPLL